MIRCTPPGKEGLSQSQRHIYLAVDPAFFLASSEPISFCLSQTEMAQWDRRRCRSLTEPPSSPAPLTLWCCLSLGSRRTRESSKNYLLFPVQKWKSLGTLEVFVITGKICPASLTRSFAPYNKLSAPFRLGLFCCFPSLAQLSTGCFRVWPSWKNTGYIQE